MARVLGLLQLLIASLLIFPVPLYGDSCAEPFGDTVLKSGVDKIRLYPSNLTNTLSTAMNGAKVKWNGCGSGVAEFATSGSGDMAIVVEYRDEIDTANVCRDRCGCFDWNLQWDGGLGKWVIQGGVVKFFKQKSSGAACNTPSSSGQAAISMLHEFGHVLGLDDIDQGCANRIMKSQPTVSSLNTQDCAGARDAANEANGAVGSIGDEEPNNECVNDPCETTATSPILISTLGYGFELTSLEDGVFFDLNANGIPEATAWTSASSDDAFLVLDRNGNGTVDDGSELFGNHTLQPVSSSPNGYIALGVWDDAFNGGDQDGHIDSEDAIFGSLQLWIDSNHNGFSEAEELFSLEDFGVESIDLDYIETGKVDKYGNEFRFISRVLTDSGLKWSWDVFFLTLE